MLLVISLLTIERQIHLNNLAYNFITIIFQRVCLSKSVMFEIEIHRYTSGFYLFYYQINLLIIIMYL